MRRLALALLLLFANSAGMAEENTPLCVSDPESMPASWRASSELAPKLNRAPWAKNEAVGARAAIRAGLDEMVTFFEGKPEAVQNLWDDSVEAMIQLTHGSANAPELDAKAEKAARQNLKSLVTTYVKLDPDWALCEEFDPLLPVAIFAHRLLPAKDDLLEVITKRTNAAFRACGSLDAAIELDYRKILAGQSAGAENIEDQFDLYLYSLWLIEAKLYPAIELPNEAHALGGAIWKYFEGYRLPRAEAFKNNVKDENFLKLANLATRIAHIPTGTHRHPLYIAYKPDLYRFFRVNFYPVLNSGDLSLLGSFVDSLRQYGCTPENDVQVRDGMRHLLDLYRKSNNRWMDYRPASETSLVLDDFARLSLPWKALLALRERNPEKAGDGTYGGIVRRWLPDPPE